MAHDTGAHVETIRLEISGKIATVTIDRPPVNAFTATTFREITDTFKQLSTQTDVHVAILTAAGERAFCGGVDLQDSAKRLAGGGGSGSAVDLLDPGVVVRECFWSVLDCSLPVIGAINGAAVGAGVALAACCDLLVASTKARFALTEINAGVLGGGRHMQRLVGPHLTRRMFYTGEFVSAEEFMRRGSVEAVVAPEELLATANELAAKIAAKSPIGVRLAKESLNRVEYLPLKEGYRCEQDYTLRISRYKDSAEARNAYLEKRDPEWSWS
jgi:enoyl-CoA hydratase